jgi:hypothetical protein
MVGGKFGIDSAPGQGTTVTAQIPFVNGKVRRENLEPTAPVQKRP